MTEGAELGNIAFNYNEAKYGPNTFRDLDHISPEHKHHIETHSWPHRLKEILNIENHFNNAYGGSSNRRIARTSLLDITNLLTQYAPEEILVVIGWTAFDRFEYFETINFSQIVPSYHVKGFASRVTTKHITMYDEIANNSLVELYTRHILQVLSLKHFLDAKGIKYQFSYSLTTFLESQFGQNGVLKAFISNSELNQMINMMEYETWHLSPSMPPYKDNIQLADSIHKGTFFSNSQDNKYPMGNGLHPLEDAHLAWATDMAETLKRRGLI